VYCRNVFTNITCGYVIVEPNLEQFGVHMMIAKSYLRK